jgi:hypothetical protein
MFEEITEDCMIILQKHHTKGDSWKTCQIDFLRKKLIEECNEWFIASEGKGNEQLELLDIINMCVMLRKRKELDMIEELSKVIKINEER